MKIDENIESEEGEEENEDIDMQAEEPSTVVPQK